MSSQLNLPCSVVVPCYPCNISPIANLTAESPDSEIFIGESWIPPSGPPPPPTIGGLWTATGCLGLCTSTISQDDADLCAENQVSLCQISNRPGTQLFPNTPQSCTVLCPDGSPFTYTVPAGTVMLMSSQAAADAAAYQIACTRAAALKICFGGLPGCTCLGAAYSGTVTVTGGTPPIAFSVFSGQLPPGLGLSTNSQNFTISGHPTTAGTYIFVIQGIDSKGSFMRKTYSMVVLAVITTQLPAFSIGTPYSFQLQAAGGSGNYLWKIVSGVLPNGLVMSSTGLISGTPM